MASMAFDVGALAGEHAETDAALHQMPEPHSFAVVMKEVRNLRRRRAVGSEKLGRPRNLNKNGLEQVQQALTKELLTRSPRRRAPEATAEWLARAPSPS